MVVAIGDAIINEIKTLPFIDKYAGVVKPVVYMSKTKVKQTFPAYCRLTLAECESGKYLDLAPDSSKKSVLYLEDKGANLIKEDAAYLNWQAKYDLVCWLNLPLLGFEGCSYSAIAINSIISKLPKVPFNIPNHFKKVAIKVTGQAPKGQNPMAKYTYDETVTQFLMYPFDHFTLNITVDFIIDKRCLTIEPIGTPLACS